MWPQYPPAPSTRIEFLPLCACDVSSDTLPPWLQSGAYVVHAAWSHPDSKPSVTWATAERGRSASAKRAGLNMVTGWTEDVWCLKSEDASRSQACIAGRGWRYLFLVGDGTWQLSLNVVVACTPQSVARLD